MTRTTRALVAGVVLAGMVGYATARTIARTSETVDAVTSGQGVHVDGFPWGPVLVIVSLLLLRFAFKAGQYHRGYMHARGIRRSHWAAISGRGH